MLPCIHASEIGSTILAPQRPRPELSLTIEQPASVKNGRMRDGSTDQLLPDREHYRELAGEIRRVAQMARFPQQALRNPYFAGLGLPRLYVPGHA